MYDFIIIGSGVIGSTIARELSKFNVQTLLLEKENDVSCGASKANSGIVHGGYDAKHGTKKSYFSRRGNRMFQKLDNELHFGYEECGSLVLAFNDKEVESINKLMENGIKNGLEDLEIIDNHKILELEPYVSENVKKALYCKTAGITSPYELTIALAENAVSNGVQLELNSKVIEIDKVNDIFKVYIKDAITKKAREVEGRYIINCAGVYSDKIANMVGIYDFKITPRRGEYILLNKNQGHLANSVLFQAPSEKGKGILVTKTYHGNLMLGPNSQEIQDPSEVGTNLEVLKYIVDTARKTVKDFNLKYTLTSFSGIRPTSTLHDFIIEESKVKNFINVAGIESPGITASPAIGEYVLEIIKKLEPAMEINKNFNPNRKPYIVPKDDNFKGVIDSDKPSENIICKCERVTEAEIVDAISRGINITSLDAIKRRTRAGMGPCQGSYCGKHVAKIIAREMNINEENVTLRGAGSSSLPKSENRTFWRELDN